MAEYERAREQIAKFQCLEEGIVWERLPQKQLGSINKERYFEQADRILSLVEIRADDQSLPESILSILGMRLVNATVKVMLKAGFVKVVPKPNV